MCGHKGFKSGFRRGQESTVAEVKYGGGRIAGGEMEG
jgi:hypothetical protein